MIKKTKIIATIGPSSSIESVMEKMVVEGADIFRLNFSHGNYETFREWVRRVRRVEDRLGLKIPILQDLQGIKIRISEVEEPFDLEEGDEVLLKVGRKPSNESVLYVDYENLVDDLKVGYQVILGDGDIVLEVVDRVDGGFLLRVLEGGTVSGRKGILFPGVSLSVEYPTEKDKKDVVFGIRELKVDYVCLSFVRSREDVLNFKNYLAELGLPTPFLIAKIEKKSAIDNIYGILEEVDGVMVARGDLGLELPVEEIPILQKEIIEIALKMRKIVIVATQMLESMIQHSKPTRAEVTDVANAIIDGADCLMLSGETASGKYPVEAVKMMASVISATESRLKDRILTYYVPGATPAESIALGAKEIADNVRAKAIVVLTRTGFTPLVISRLKPKIPVFALTYDSRTFAKMHTYWGVEPVLIERDMELTDEALLPFIDVVLRERVGLAKRDIVVLVASSPLLGKRNMIRLYRIGEVQPRD